MARKTVNRLKVPMADMVNSPEWEELINRVSPLRDPGTLDAPTRPPEPEEAPLLPSDDPSFAELGVDVPRSRGLGSGSRSRIIQFDPIDIEGSPEGTALASNEGLGDVEAPNAREFVRREDLRDSPEPWSVDEEGTVYLPREASFLMPGGPFRDESRRQIAERLRNMEAFGIPLIPEFVANAIDVERDPGEEELPSYNAPALNRGILNPGGIPVFDLATQIVGMGLDDETAARMQRERMNQRRDHSGSLMAGEALGALATAPLMPTGGPLTASSGTGRTLQAGFRGAVGGGLAGGAMGVMDELGQMVEEGRGQDHQRIADLADEANVSPQFMADQLLRRRLGDAAGDIGESAGRGAVFGGTFGAAAQGGSEFLGWLAEQSRKGSETAQRLADRARIGALGGRARDVRLAEEQYPGGVHALANELRAMGATGPVATSEELRPTVEEALQASGSEIDDFLRQYDEAVAVPPQPRPLASPPPLPPRPPALPERIDPLYETMSNDPSERLDQILSGRVSPEDIDEGARMAWNYGEWPPTEMIEAARAFRAKNAAQAAAQDATETVAPGARAAAEDIGAAETAAGQVAEALPPELPPMPPVMPPPLPEEVSAGFARFGADEVESQLTPFLSDLDRSIVPEQHQMAQRIREVIGNARSQYPDGMSAAEFARVKRDLQGAINWNSFNNPPMQRAYQETLQGLTRGFDDYLAGMEGSAMPEGIASGYQASRRRYGAAARASDWIDQEASKVAGSPIDLRDMVASSGLTSPVRWFLSRQLRQRGHSAAATLLESMARPGMIQRLGPAANALAAAAQRGPAAFVVAYEMLREERPEIDQIISEEQQQDDELMQDVFGAEPSGSAAPNEDDELMRDVFGP